MKNLRERFDRGTLAFVSKINIYGFGLMVFWTVTNIVLLPTRVEETVRESLQGTALGLISFLGVGFAVIVQPIAGRMSDAWPGEHRRRPFIVAGTLFVIPGLFFFGTGVQLWALLVGFVAMQLGTNIAQAAFQAFIPDLGLLEASTWWAGRNFMTVQYWHSLDQLMRYATGKDGEHFPAWQAFMRRCGHLA